MYKAFQALGVVSAALDGNDLAKEGEWVDSAGQLLTYTNWYPGQPPNNHGIKDYLGYANNGQWYNGHGGHVENIVCERSVRSKTF